MHFEKVRTKVGFIIFFLNFTSKALRANFLMSPITYFIRFRLLLKKKLNTSKPNYSTPRRMPPTRKRNEKIKIINIKKIVHLPKDEKFRKKIRRVFRDKNTCSISKI